MRSESPDLPKWEMDALLIRPGLFEMKEWLVFMYEVADGAGFLTPWPERGLGELNC